MEKIDMDIEFFHKKGRREDCLEIKLAKNLTRRFHGKDQILRLPRESAV